MLNTDITRAVYDNPNIGQLAGYGIGLIVAQRILDRSMSEQLVSPYGFEPKRLRMYICTLWRSEKITTCWATRFM
jgi:hypothetical protein